MGKTTIYFFSEADKSSIEYGLSNFTDLSVKIPGKFEFFPFTKEDLIFPNAEAAFQAYKCHEDKDSVQRFLTCTNPRKAKGKKPLLLEL